MILLALVIVSSPTPIPMAKGKACANVTIPVYATAQATVFLPGVVLAHVPGSSMTALVDVAVGADGRRIAAHISKSSGNESLDEAAIETAQASVYTPKLVNCKSVAGDYSMTVPFPGVSALHARNIPKAVVQALEQIAALHATRSGFCDAEEGWRAFSEARKGEAKKEWSQLVAPQQAYAAELAQCALMTVSPHDFRIIAGFSVASLVSSIGADVELRDTYAYQYTATAPAKVIATWLINDPQVFAKERVWQSNLTRELKELTRYATGLDGGYPIAFLTEPDWRGTYAGDQPRALVTTKALGHDVVGLFAGSQGSQLDSEQAATDAYEIAFRDYKWSPRANAFLVVTIYSRAVNGVSDVFGYVFALDSKKRWRPRLVPPRERDSVEEGLGSTRTGLRAGTP